MFLIVLSFFFWWGGGGEVEDLKETFWVGRKEKKALDRRKAKVSKEET